MSVTFGFHPIALLFAVLGAALLTIWTYRRTRPKVSTARRAVLIGLRFTTLCILLLLLAEPIVRLIQSEERPPILVVLIDSSQSLGLQEASEGVDLPAEVRATLSNLPLDAVNGDVRLYTFDRVARPADEGLLQTPDSLVFKGERTDIAAALAQIRDEFKDENLRGVLLVSDGRYNTGRNPLYLAERFPVPVHSVVVGDTTSRKDVQVRRVTTNEIAYVDVELPIQVGLRSDGFDGEQARVSLFNDGERLATEVVQLPQGIAEVPVDLAFVPAAEGLQRLTVTVSEFDGEVTHANNAESFTVRVLKSKQRVLLLAATAEPDLSAIRQILGADKNIEVTARTQKTPSTFYEGNLPSDLGSFDAIVLVGFPGAGADRGAAQRVATAAAEGVPIFFLLSRQTNLQLLTELFSETLPVAPVTVRPRFSEASLEVTPDGELHPILQIDDVPDDGWRMLPPLAYNESLWEPSPDARTLATIRIRGIGLNDPILTIRKRNNLRSAALLGAGTWRWKNVPQDLEAVSTYWPDLLSNILQWITTREDDRPVRVNPIESLFGGAESVEFTGQVYDESLNPVEDATVDVTVTAPDNRAFEYTMEPIGNGRYVLDIGSLPEGTYQYEATGRVNDQVAGEDNGVFAVGRLTLEFKETRADATLMRQLATRSQGTFLHASEIGTLPEHLAASDTFRPVTVENERERELWHYYIFLILALLLLTAEWVLRKRSGMV